jgi:thymidylate kinase
MTLPDCVIVLDVSPEVSAARKPDHAPAVLEAKIKGVRSLIEVIRSEHRDVRLIHINADQPFDEVVLQLKRNIWSAL